MPKRVAIVVLAYAVACYVAGLVINVELFGWKLLIEREDASLDPTAGLEAIGAMLLLSPMVGAYVAVFALLPFLVVLPIMLRLGWTSRPWALTTGALVGLVHPVYDVLRWQIYGGGPENWIPGTLGFGSALAIAGACAALTFRAMAARALGLIEVSAPPTPPG